MKNFIRISIVGLVLALEVGAQVGGIRGVVMDKDFEVPLPGVRVRISETGQEALSGDTGAYLLENIEPGAYTLLFSKGGYSRFTRPEVVVSPGQLAEVQADLAGEYEEMDELVVRDIQMGGASEIGLLNLRMESSALMDSVGADLMSKAGASDAAQALTLVSGTTVQDGKYAVVRGLPDRYVSTQMNSVRLPSADPKTRAVQLDQFPASMIESMQVSKTFTPDQQGDASGGAVNVVLKGVPKERVISASLGFEVNSQVADAWDRFLTHRGGGVSAWGNDADSITPQAPGTDWSGAVGVSRDGAPYSYKLGVTLAEAVEWDSGIKGGVSGSFFYKRDASYSENGIDDKYWQKSAGAPLTPEYSGNDNLDGNMFNTKLYDVTKASDELQWGTLGIAGIESDQHKLSLLYSYTFSAEDRAVLKENTRGKYYYFPGHDPYNQYTEGHYDDPVNGDDNTEGSRFRRNETLEYLERETDTLQLHGEHTLPVWELEPELDWTLARSTSSLKSPDKKLFESFWVPPYLRNGDPNRPQGNVHQQINDGSAGGLGNLYRVWKSVEEESTQFFMNGKVPFEQWGGEEGFIKLGYFGDQVEREYLQDTFNSDPSVDSTYSGDWTDLWSANYEAQNHPILKANVDASYDGEQETTAFYQMLNLPLTSFLDVTAGARFEDNRIATTVTDADGGTLRLYLPPSYGGIVFAGNEHEANANYEQQDWLPALRTDIDLSEKIVLIASYSETVAKQTFRELTPIVQQEDSGGDLFVGNPYLTMSAVQNYDLRLDYNPYPGGLVSVSWFYKQIEDPIEYKQVLLGGANLATTPDNYPEGTMNGFELEARQSMGELWEPLEDFQLGGNFTLIDSEVELPADEKAYLQSQFGVTRDSRAMLQAPEYLYNINASYLIPKVDTEIGLFYTFKGDTLLVGAGNAGGNFAPDIFAKERGTLNLTLSKKFGDHFKVSFKAKNLTDSPVEEIYRSEFVPGGDVIRRSYTKGIEYSVGISGTW